MLFANLFTALLTNLAEGINNMTIDVNRYQNSQAQLKLTEKIIPLGSQTFSKSKIAYPENVSPLFIQRAQGCQAWDIDDNQYTDFVSGLLSVFLGFGDEDVNNGVIAQLNNGVTFSLPHILEYEVAQLLVELIPCAEMVRFGKNGSDATSAAIRLARAYNQKEHLAVCGYHGWQDWYIGSTTRDLGVPQATKALTHSFQYNNIDSLNALFEQYPQQISAVILEPMNVEYPKDNFLAKVKLLCQQHNTVLIFDETITGFRFSQGGAQQLFDVEPDLATFGKGMANGFPISAIVGKKEIMSLMTEIFFSGTFAGETLSLAASKAVLSKVKNQPILAHIHSMGELLIDGLNALIDKYQAQNWLSVCGHPSWSFFVIKDCAPYSAIELKSLYLQEMLKNGILINASHNLTFAHKQHDIELLLGVYDKIIKLMTNTVEKQNFDLVFHGKTLEPVFKVR